jgi:hypothetical protein
MTYGIATGRTPEEAIANARIDLANQILTLVQKKTTSETTVQQSQSGQSIQQQAQQTQKVQAATFSTVELENTKIIASDRLDNKQYYAVIGADQQTIARIKAKARQTASTLVVINQLQNAQSITEKIHLIEQGLTEIETHQIQDDTVLVEGKRFTFGSYFDSVLNSTLQQIKTAVTKDNEVYDVYLLEAQTLNPISGVKVQVNQREGYTDKLGRLIVASLPKTTNIRLVIHKKPYLLNTFIKGSSHGTIYVNTQPKGFLAELKENGQVIASVTTPEEIPLDQINPDAQYEIVLHGNKQYPTLTRRIQLTPGFDAVFFKQFEKLTFGGVDLKLEDEDNEIDVHSPKGQLLYAGPKGYKNPKLPVGTYQVEVQTADHDPEYQIIEDQFSLRKNQWIKRTYAEPQYRKFYRKGSNWNLGFIFGGSPTEEAKYKTSTGTYTGKQLNYDPTSVGYGLEYRYFTTYAFIGGGAGIIATSDDANRTYANTTLSGFPLDFFGGIYKDFDGNHLCLEGGYRKLSLSQDSSSYQKLETDISSPFIGVHYNFGGFQLGARYFTAGNSTMSFFLGFGNSQLDEGYELPARVTAVKGVHYQEN